MSAEEVAVYDLPFSGVEASIMGWVQEALELRHGAAGDPAGKLSFDGVRDYQSIEALLARVRQRSDRVDELFSKITQARGRVKRADAQAKFAAEIALMEATQRAANSPKRREFSTREERNSEASLEAIKEKRLAFQSQRLVDIATEAWDVINQIHWSLDGIRKDLRASLHALQFESSLEH